MKPIWNGTMCLRCGSCVGSCPAGAMRLRQWGVDIIDSDCTGCGTCIRVCPVGTIDNGGD
ncbi:MAG: 4Fe-4S binding protein [Thermoplasmatota archaeon]